MTNIPLDYIQAALALPRSLGFGIIYFIVAIAPVLIWLWIYLRQDKHPEPRREILAVFLLGAFITAPAVYAELFLTYDCAGAGCVPGLFYRLGLPSLVALILSVVVGIAFVEEFAKYAVVWLKEQAIGNNSQLDEPIDFVMYMVVAALGFAAAENLLLLLKYTDIQWALVFRDSLIRSVTAILVHTLCSGILGYYMAMTFCHRDKKIRYLVFGIATVSLLHGLYDLSIIGSGDNLGFLLLVLGSIIAMGYLFCEKLRGLKKMKSVCDMKIK